MAAAPPEAAGSAGGEAAPEVAVVVINWQREDATAECCRRLLGWSRLRPHVVVVDNGSSVETVERLEDELIGVTVLAAENNRGFGGANNLALTKIQSEFILLLNNDAEIAEASVALLTEFLRANPEVGIAGPVLEASRKPHEVLAAGGRDILRFGRTHLRPHERAEKLQANEPFSVDYVPGTAVLVRSSLLRQLAGFDETYFFSGEMADLSARARRLGFESVVVPAARARHDLTVASDLRGSLYAYYSLRNRFLHAHRHARRPRWSQSVWAARGALSCLRALAHGQGRHARCLAAAIADGLTGHFGEASSRVAQ